jgi:NADPH-dependent ferric siderophore reductase
MSAERTAVAEADAAETPFVLARARVAAVERISPTFARIAFAGPELHAIGTPGRVFDQRIKLVFPAPGLPLPELTSGRDWWEQWLAVPEEARGSMRTYSIRALEAGPDATRLVVDFVLHLAEGASGPASRWAGSAAVGDEILLVGPRRGRTDGGGLEYDPGDAARVLLAGDETAAPAIARILEDADRGLRGAAFVEVPRDADALPVDAPSGVALHWLPRGDADVGSALIPAVLRHLGGGTADSVRDLDGEELLWETPAYSGLGEPLDDMGTVPDDRYVWIAGESGVVTTLRRHLVTDLGLPRRRVAFMGYWRRGVAMRG